MMVFSLFSKKDIKSHLQEVQNLQVHLVDLENRGVPEIVSL